MAFSLYDQYHIAKCFDIILPLRRYNKSYIIYQILHGGYVLDAWSNMIFHAVLHTYKIGTVTYIIPSYFIAQYSQGCLAKILFPIIKIN